MLLVSLLYPKEHTDLRPTPTIGCMANDFVNNSHPDLQKHCSFLLASELYYRCRQICERYPGPQRNFFFFFLATLVKMRDDKQLLSHFKVLLDMDFVSGAARVRCILPMMAVSVQISNVFPGPRIGLDSVLAFQGQVLDSSAVFGTAGPLSCFRLTVCCLKGPSVCLQFIVILSLIL